MTILEVVKVTKRFGGLEALKDVDLRLEAGALVGLIGPNGAGKSTLFNVLSGVTRPTSGEVFFRGENIIGMQPHLISVKGLVRTFQANRLYMNLSVSVNVEIACHNFAHENVIGDIIGLPSIRQREGEVKKRAADIVKLAGLETVSEELARNLPHGYQRALGVACGLAPEPKLLCLDEPVTGMNIEETKFMTDLIVRLKQKGITIFLVEHHMGIVMGICDRIIVLNFGRKIAEGNPDEVRKNQDVIEAYLGRGAEHVA